MDSLIRIQAELKAPKGQFNKFGGYKYRSCEDILEAVKPLLSKENATLVLSDEVECIGDRFYIKALALFKDKDGKEAKVYAYAREPEDKKGMDGSQITGTASSYARKYALNGLFLIDDTKDNDTNEHKKEVEERAKKEKGTKKDNTVQNGTKNEEREKARQELIDLCSVKCIDMKEIATEFKLNSKCGKEKFEKAIEEVKKR